MSSSWSRNEIILFGYGCTLRRGVFFVVRRVLCAKVVGATSSEGFLLLKRVSDSAVAEAPIRIWHTILL